MKKFNLKPGRPAGTHWQWQREAFVIQSGWRKEPFSLVVGSIISLVGVKAPRRFLSVLIGFLLERRISICVDLHSNDARVREKCAGNEEGAVRKSTMRN